jgi:hypothetical protein
MIDCIYVKIRDGAVASGPVYVAVGIGLDGERDVLGLGVGDGGEGAKHWMSVLAELRNRGVADVLVVCCDGLKGLPESIAEIWPQATVQLCVVHLVRTSLKYAAKQHWGPVSKALKRVYTAPTADAAAAEFEHFKAEWSGQYPMIARTWEAAWEQFTPFLAFPPEIRRVIYTTNMIESMNALPPSGPPSGSLPFRPGRAEGALPGHSRPAQEPTERGRQDRRLEAGTPAVRLVLQRPRHSSDRTMESEPITLTHKGSYTPATTWSGPTTSSSSVRPLRNSSVGRCAGSTGTRASRFASGSCRERSTSGSREWSPTTPHSAAHGTQGAGTRASTPTPHWPPSAHRPR